MTRNRNDKTPHPYAMPDEWAEFARTRPPRRETAGSILASILGIAVALGLLAALALNWGL